MDKKTGILLLLFWLPGIIGAKDTKQDRIDQAFLAIQKNNKSGIQELIKDREILDAIDQYGSSLLHEAIIQESEDIVKILLDAGIDLEKKTRYGDYSPLLLACMRGNFPIFNLLIGRGAALSQPERLVLNAARGGNFEIVKFLVEEGLSLNVQEYDRWTPLHYSLLRGKLKIVEYIYQKEKRLGSRPFLIHSAANSGNIDVVEFCLKLGQAIDSQDEEGWTPLHRAVFEGFVDLVKFLLGKGASPHKMSTSSYERRNDHVVFNEGSTPLAFAVLNNDLQSTSAIIKKTGRKRFLHQMIQLFFYSQIYGYHDMGRFLISRCSDINLRDDFGWTLLHHAAHLWADEETILLILKKGANPKAQTLKDYKDLYNREFPKGSTAEQVAGVIGNPNMARALSKLNFPAVEPKKFKLVLVGKDHKLDISPDGSIWIVIPSGIVFSTASVEKQWHAYSILQNEDSKKWLLSTYKRISHFNDQTAIISGSIYANGKNVVKRTDDSGKTWHDITYGGDAWIYDVFCGGIGEAWMGGSSGEIYFTADDGAHWQKMNSPFDSHTRLHAIFMIDKYSGIAGALHNSLYMTSDNWQTFTRIPTPFDQKLTDGSQFNYLDGRINQVVWWNDYYLVDQDGFICFTKRDRINWKIFSLKLLSFAVDPTTSRCFAVTEGLKVVELFSSGEDIQVAQLGTFALKSKPITRRARDSFFYVLDEDVYIYRINEKEFLRKPIMVEK